MILFMRGDHLCELSFAALVVHSMNSLRSDFQSFICRQAHFGHSEGPHLDSMIAFGTSGSIFWDQACSWSNYFINWVKILCSNALFYKQGQQWWFRSPLIIWSWSSILLQYQQKVVMSLTQDQIIQLPGTDTPAYHQLYICSHIDMGQR